MLTGERDWYDDFIFQGSKELLFAHLDLVAQWKAIAYEIWLIQPMPDANPSLLTAIFNPNKVNGYFDAILMDRLPQGLTVVGHLNLRESNIKELPENLTVHGDLDIRETELTFDTIPLSANIEGWIKTEDGDVKRGP